MNVTGGDDVIALERALGQLVAETRAGVEAVVVAETAALEARVKRHASQPRTRPRPLPTPMRTEGPRALTGSYRSSIHSQVDHGPFQTVGRVGSNDVRAMPLERGSSNLFGRGIRMRAYEHYAPAMAETENEFLAAIAAVPMAAAARTRGGRVRGFIGRLFGRAS